MSRHKLTQDHHPDDHPCEYARAEGRAGRVFRTLAGLWGLVVLLPGACTPPRPRSPAEIVHRSGPDSSGSSAASAGGTPGKPEKTPGVSPLRVGMLLPLSGPRAAEGRALLQGAMVGICDWGAPLTLYPVDTQGTPEGVRAALKVLEQRDPACILGPLLFPEVQEVVRVWGQARGGPHPPVVAFSNDPATCKTLEPFGVCLGNFLQDRVSALLDQGKKQSWSVYALLVPDTPWGRAVRDVIREALEQRRLRCSTEVLFNPSRIDPGVFDALRDSGKADAWILVDHGARLEALMAHLEALRPGIPVILPGVVSPEAVMSLASDNLWMALPCQSRMDGFRARYKNLFGQVPPGLASLSYDSLALVVLARDEKVQTSMLSFWQRPQGFEGLQATFRFVDGASRLLMGVWQKKGGELHGVQPPQERF